MSKVNKTSYRLLQLKMHIAILSSTPFINLRVALGSDELAIMRGAQNHNECKPVMTRVPTQDHRQSPLTSH